MTPADYRTLREKLGSQEQVAAQLGVTGNTIARRERGEVPITLEHAYALYWLASKSKSTNRQLLSILRKS